MHDAVVLEKENGGEQRRMTKENHNKQLKGSDEEQQCERER